MFNEFWRFVTERQAVYHRRTVLKQPLPWTKDPILANYHFTNVYREQDIGTVWFAGWARGRSAGEVLWGSLLYRPINRVSTFERLGGIPDFGQYREWLERLVRLDRPIFTGRHQTRGLAQYIRMVNNMGVDFDLFSPEVLAASSPETVMKVLMSVDGIGGFFAFQIYLDLVEAKALPFGEDAYARIGQGSEAGLRLLYPLARRRDYLRLVDELRVGQHDVITGLGLVLLGPPLTLKNVEHSLCEFSKYWCLQRGLPAKAGRREWTI